MSILAFFLEAFSSWSRGGETQAEQGGFAELRKQRLEYRKLSQLKFDGQSTAKNESTDGNSSKSAQRFS